MMFRGTPSISAGGLDDIIARLGAQMNGETRRTTTRHFYFDMPADSVDVALQHRSRPHAACGAAAADWHIERGAVLNEIDGDESSPFFNLLSRVRAAAYPGHRRPAARRSACGPTSRARPSPTLRTYYDEWYAPNNATLVVAGDVSHTQGLRARAALFRRDSRRKTLPPHAAVHPQAGDAAKSVEAEFPFPFEVLDLAYAIPGDTEHGEPAVSTLSTLIPNQRSPFYQALVQSNIALADRGQRRHAAARRPHHVFIILNPGHTRRRGAAVFQSTMDSRAAERIRSRSRHRRKTPDDGRARRTRPTRSTDIGDLAGYTYGIVGENATATKTRGSRR